MFEPPPGRGDDWVMTDKPDGGHTPAPSSYSKPVSTAEPHSTNDSTGGSTAATLLEDVYRLGGARGGYQAALNDGVDSTPRLHKVAAPDSKRTTLKGHASHPDGHPLGPPGGVEMDRLVRAVVRIQAVARGFLTRREAVVAHGHANVLLPKSRLIERLREYPDGRTSKVYFIFYLVFATLALTGFSLHIRPSEGFAALGTVRNQFIKNGDMPMYDVRSIASFWKFSETALANNLLWFDVTGSNSSYPFLGPNTYLTSESLNLVIQRNEAALCSSQFTQDGVWRYFARDNCRVPGSYNRAEHGGTSSSSLEANTVIGYYLNNTAYEIESATVDQYIGSSATLCPIFRHYENGATVFQTFTESRGGYMLAFNMFGSTTTTRQNLKLVFEMLQRCNAIDWLSYDATWELYLMVAFPRPMLAIFMITFSFDSSGGVAISERSVVLELSKNSAREKAAFAIFVLTFIVVTLAAAGQIFDYAFNQLVSQDLWYGIAYVTEPHHFLGWCAYVSTMIACIVFWVYTDELTKMVNTTEEDLLGETFYNRVQAVIQVAEIYRYSSSVSIFFIFTRMLGYSRHRGMMSIVWKVGRVVFVPTLHFLFAFTFVLLSFSLTAYNLWGDLIEEYHSIEMCIHTLLMQLAGAFDYNLTANRDSIAGLIFFGLFFIVVGTLGMNFFVAIVLEGYTTVATHHNVNLPVWSDLYFDAWNFRAIIQDTFAKDKLVSTSHCAFVLKYDPVKAESISVLRLKRLAGGALTVEASDCVMGVMKDEGIDEVFWKSASDPPYRYLDMDLLGVRYGKGSRTAVWRTPLFMRRYTLTYMEMRRRIQRYCQRYRAKRMRSKVQRNMAGARNGATVMPAQEEGVSTATNNQLEC